MTKKRLIGVIAAFFSFFIGFNFITFGQATATLEDNQLLMGNRMKLIVKVPLPNDSASVDFPMLKDALLQKRKYVSLLNDTVEIRVDHRQSLEVSEDKYWMNYDLYIQAFDSGKYTLPPLEFIVNGEKVETNPVTFEVIPVKVTADDPIDDFSDIAEPFEINPNPEELDEENSNSWLWWLIGVAALILLFIIFYYIYLRKGGKNIFVPKPKPIYIQALNKLNKLQQQNLPQKGKTKEYYTRLTDILRWYLKKQFGIKTLEKASSEILYIVENDMRTAEYAPILKSIFGTADFVKFAKVNPSVVENGRCLTEAIKFVELSHPKEEINIKKGGNL